MNGVLDLDRIPTIKNEYPKMNGRFLVIYEDKGLDDYAIMYYRHEDEVTIEGLRKAGWYLDNDCKNEMEVEVHFGYKIKKFWLLKNLITNNFSY